MSPRRHALSVIVGTIVLLRMLESAGHAQVPTSTPTALPTCGLLEIAHDTSLTPLRAIPTPEACSTGAGRRLEVPAFGQPTTPDSITVDPVLQTGVGPLANTISLLGFEGLAGGDRPDANGAVGAYQFVETTNFLFGIYGKSTGQLQYCALENTLFQGFTGDGGQCANNTTGDGVVLYDHLANRWLITYIGSISPPFEQCLAVSVSEDAGGLWYRYALQLPNYGDNNFGDYPKIGVWPDAYYMSFDFSQGTAAVALHRDAMLTGGDSSPQCFQLDTGMVFPSDLDGPMLPPVGSPNYFMTTKTQTTLSMYKFHVDFSTPANSRFTGPINIPVAHYLLSPPDATIQQAGTNQLLQPRGDIIMHRVAYRNFGDHQSLVVNHESGLTYPPPTPPIGIRWYELRDLNSPPPTPPTVYQQGTFAGSPLDLSNSRWVGSIAMDMLGDIGLGYSVSGSASHPGIRYTGRQPSDALGTLQAETTVQIDNQGSKTTSHGWGDYTSMSVDPVFDCSFWYTNEYFRTNGGDWNTHIASFRFPSCVGCVGDCNYNLEVTVDELTRLTDIINDFAPITICLRADANGDGELTVNEYIQADNNFNRGCPTGAQGEKLGHTKVPPGDALTLEIGTVSGAPGSRVSIPIVLGGSGEIVAAQLDLLYPTDVLSDPACVRAPHLTHDVLETSSPSTPPPPAGAMRLRTLLIPGQKIEPVPHQELYSCTFTISPTAPSGTFGLVGENQHVSDKDGNEPLSTVVNGAVTVL